MGGRFLNLDDSTKRWFILPDAVVLDKIKQALRDKYVPFWAKNMDIPSALPGPKSEQEYRTASAKYTSRVPKKPSCEHSSEDESPSKKKKAARKSHKSSLEGARDTDSNKLDFLLSASRIHGATPAASIPTVDDILKCKIDTLPGFGGRTSFMAEPRMLYTFPPPMSADPRLSFSLPPGYGATAMGMGIFHSIHDAGFMGSLGGGAGAYGGDGISSHGFGVGGNMGAPSLGELGLPPTSSPGLLNSFALRSMDLDKYILNPSEYPSTARSIDVLRSLTGGGMTSIGSLSGLPSLGLSDAFGLPAGGESLSQTPGEGIRKTKTDWDKMYAKALSGINKEEV
jgi:hypothetical protein